MAEGGNGSHEVLVAVGRENAAFPESPSPMAALPTSPVTAVSLWFGRTITASSSGALAMSAPCRSTKARARSPIRPENFEPTSSR